MAGLEPEDMLFDPLCLVIKGMQDKQVEVLEAIRMMTEMGLLTTGGLSNVSRKNHSFDYMDLCGQSHAVSQNILWLLEPATAPSSLPVTTPFAVNRTHIQPRPPRLHPRGLG